MYFYVVLLCILIYVNIGVPSPMQNMQPPFIRSFDDTNINPNPANPNDPFAGMRSRGKRVSRLWNNGDGLYDLLLDQRGRMYVSVGPDQLHIESGAQIDGIRLRVSRRSEGRGHRT